ncbi:NB-ARC domain-containing protein [Microbacterium sp. T32]|uniref:NB-ARC domain-containing protein n=1 Tax=Microbacterium sp. T32 TaxID=1776083 RepID=UPI0018D3B40D|nr:NB-ARC domain-containing protein [Microbacterium sp. T32]
MLLATLAFVDDDLPGEHRRMRLRLNILFGLDDAYRLYQAGALFQKATDDIPRLRRQPHENSSMWEGRERPWRRRAISAFAEALVLAAERDWVLPSPEPKIDRVFDLDPATRVLVGRDEEVRQLEGSTRRVLLITGPPGVGKTALARTLANQMAARFGDGCLQIDFHAYSASPEISVADGLRSLLQRLGHREEDLPYDEVLLTSMFRSIAEAQEILIFADNVKDSRTVLALAGGRRSIVIVTSRSELPALYGEIDVEHVALDILDLDECLDLFRIYLEERVDREEEYAVELAKMCGRLPLALTIVAASTSRRKRVRLSTVVNELRASRAGVLDLSLPESEVTIAAVLGWSLRRLSFDQVRLLASLAMAKMYLIEIDAALALHLGSRHDLDTLAEDKLLTLNGETEIIDIADLTLNFLDVFPALEHVRGRFGERNELRVIVSDVRIQAHEALKLIDSRQRAVGHSLVSEPWKFTQKLPDQFERHRQEMTIYNLRHFGHVQQRWGGYEDAFGDLLQSANIARRSGAFDHSVAAIRDLYALIGRWEATSESELPVIGGVDDLVALVWDSVCMGAARTGWRLRFAPLISDLTDLSRSRELQLERDPEYWEQNFYGSDSTSDFLEIVASFGETARRSSVAEVSTTWLERRDSLRDAERELRSHFEAGSFSLSQVEAFRVEVVAQAQSVPTIEVLWSVEPTLIWSAIRCRELGSLEVSHDLLRLAHEIYVSRRTFIGHEDAVLDVLQERARLI